MAELTPYPFSKLVARMFRELETKQAIFDLPAKKFFLGDSRKNFSVKFHGKPASSPLGPASGPQSQMAQNILLCWLGGSRIIELKTVQILDELKILRPCIDMQNIGYNIEWSQELKVQQSLEEYVKGAMLIRILAASGKVNLQPDFNHVIYDMSLGYDLAGIKSATVQSYIKGMRDASALVEKFRKEIPEEFKQFRGLDFNTQLADTMTLSTFHGCPPDEIEKIIDFCLKENRLNCIIKLNPVLLGKNETRRIFNDLLGYHDIHIPESAFDKDTQWEQAVEMAGRLAETAKARGLGFGVKFSNTLIVENHRDFFPKSEKIMYLSGPPLHVLAMNLVLKWRKAFGSDAKISFAAGVDRFNFADAVALGLTPITVCSDWLKTGGYQRQSGYFEELIKRMEEALANSVGDFIIRSAGCGKAALRECAEKLEKNLRISVADHLEQSLESQADLKEAVAQFAISSSLTEGWAEAFYERWVGRAAFLNTFILAPQITQNPRYAQAENRTVPKKIGSRLQLFNCITCDKCVPVCPNDANFTYTLPQIEIPVVQLRWEENSWKETRTDKLVFNKKHQLANFADFCNECGNCDIFCPEEGGPYVMKPRFFGSMESWNKFKKYDGFYMEKINGGQKVWGRFNGNEYFLETNGSGESHFAGDGFAIRLKENQAHPSSIQNIKSSPQNGMVVDLTYFHILNWIRKGIFSETVNYINI